MPPSPSAAAIAAALQHARSFSTKVAYRQLPVVYRKTLWAPTPPGARWNPTFPALYAALDLDIALAERIKRTGRARTDLVVGMATIRLRRVLDLREPALLALLRITFHALTRDDYAATHALAAALFGTGLSGLLVPAALERAAAAYPHFWFERGDEREIRRMPTGGANLVVFPSHVSAGDEIEEIDRFECAVWGVRG